MAIERGYETILQPELEGGSSVFGPKLPSMSTQGETAEEASATAREGAGSRSYDFR